MKTLSFKNGDAMPALGLGTWKSKEGEVYEAVRQALRIGYRHIDCAAIYGNEAEIGQALRDALAEGTCTREELWITSKLWNSAHRQASVLPALEKTLKDLQLNYLDLYLIHWPVALKDGIGFPTSLDEFVSLDEVPLTETWAGMEAGVDQGLTRHIGLSNFSIYKIKQLLASARIAPEANQVESHPYLPQTPLLEFCQQEGIILTAYSPLGSNDRPPHLIKADAPVLLKDEIVASIAEKHAASPAQVLIAWALQRGTSVIPKSVSPERLRQNFEATTLELDADDMAQISMLDAHLRFIDGSTWAREGSPYLLADLWDEDK
ncbi:aldo/keto reductase [Rhabdobacter roseus]|uniref:Alcohol dehydrogenase (NADP+) n=1 Tax=Rhabdobacter roseus TaxID=1655419 RepID=A0A840TSG5_9BACT|nr:aldo/keto reductase [Rhabdobacter roseus]MBB5284512.1 alcohol dehydrogenase (NADP+) [Rhabdobacter roseus]